LGDICWFLTNIPCQNNRPDSVPNKRKIPLANLDENSFTDNFLEHFIYENRNTFQHYLSLSVKEKCVLKVI